MIISTTNTITVSTPYINTWSTKFQPKPGNIFPYYFRAVMLELDSWIIDSGVTDHIVNNLEMFTSYQPSHNLFIKVLDYKIIYYSNKFYIAKHFGSVRLFRIRSDMDNGK